MALVKRITNNTPAPLLIYLSRSPVPDRETRAFSAQQIPVIYRAMAIVSEPGLSRLVMNIVFRFQQPPIPTKSFTDAEAARAPGCGGMCSAASHASPWFDTLAAAPYTALQQERRDDARL